MKFFEGKSRYKKEIVPILQKIIDENKITQFVDCFCGGCNIVDSIKCDVRVANDNNEYLIVMWKKFQKGWKSYPTSVTKKKYQNISHNREKYNKALVGLVGYCYSWKGMFFNGYLSNNNGRDFGAGSIRSIQKQSALLKDVIFTCNDYSEIPFDWKRRTLLYCDPPHGNLKQRHGNTNSKKFDYIAFYEWCRQMSKIPNYIVVISEYAMPSDFYGIWSADGKHSTFLNEDKIERMYMLRPQDYNMPYWINKSNELTDSEQPLYNKKRWSLVCPENKATVDLMLKRCEEWNLSKKTWYDYKTLARFIMIYLLYYKGNVWLYDLDEEEIYAMMEWFVRVRRLTRHKLTDLRSALNALLYYRDEELSFSLNDTDWI